MNMDQFQNDLIVLVTAEAKNGPPTNCPFGLVIKCYLQLGGVPFKMIHQPHSDSDKLPYIECGSLRASDDEDRNLVEILKQSKLVDLDYWVGDQSKQELEKGKLFINILTNAIQYQTQGEADKVHEMQPMTIDAFHELSNILNNQPYFLGDRPTSLDAYFLGRALFIIHALKGTSLENLLKVHSNLERCVDNAIEFLGKETNWYVENEMKITAPIRHSSYRSLTTCTVLSIPRSFQPYHIQYFTSSTKSQKVVASGSFGDVHKGWLFGCESGSPGKMLIAVKKSHQLRARDEEKQWENEIFYLSNMSHPNIIKLLGYAMIGKQYCLVYEYMQKKSLSRNLQDINWSATKRIALGSARAMEYLHTRDPPIIFADFKPANIVLDENLNPKLTDFGIAEEEGNTSHGGTKGSTDPFTVNYGLRTMETDIFSMGMLLLQLLTKEKDPELLNFPDNWKEVSTIAECLPHESLQPGCTKPQAYMLAELASTYSRTSEKEEGKEHLHLEIADVSNRHYI
ncbi:hypothetical protein ACH5RR_032643 [Cinchona calisaya]|uniref:Protein kinase domain-containing protein n=1 Tax=Cinchona calisaya TaxID=153742 RepID=A0ABD2YIR1_9GENT